MCPTMSYTKKSFEKWEKDKLLTKFTDFVKFPIFLSLGSFPLPHPSSWFTACAHMITESSKEKHHDNNRETNRNEMQIESNWSD